MNYYTPDQAEREKRLDYDRCIRSIHDVIEEMPNEFYWLRMPIGLFVSLANYISAANAAASRKRMIGNLQRRIGQNLVIGDRRIDVYCDDSLPEHEVSAGVFTSNILLESDAGVIRTFSDMAWSVNSMVVQHE